MLKNKGFRSSLSQRARGAGGDGREGVGTLRPEPAGPASLHVPLDRHARAHGRAPTLTERQVVPRPVTTAQRHHVVQVRVADLESFVTGDDQLVSVPVRLVMNLSVVNLRDMAICNCVKRTRYFFNLSWLCFTA